MSWRGDHGLAPLSAHFATGTQVPSTQRAAALATADDAARRQGHELGMWQPYGRANEKARCVRCGAEARVPWSQTDGYRQPTGPAVHPSGSCSGGRARY